MPMFDTRKRDYEKGKFCPFVNGSCKEHACSLYVHILGSNPQTNKELDHWDCSLAILPMLLIDNTREVRHGAAATESFRNETMAATKVSQKIAIAQVVAAQGNQSVDKALQLPGVRQERESKND